MELHENFKPKIEKDFACEKSIEMIVDAIFLPDYSENPKFAKNTDIKKEVESHLKKSVDTKLLSKILKRKSFISGIFYIKKVKSRGFFLKMK